MAKSLLTDLSVSCEAWPKSAAALGDIGKHFPDTDPEFKGADSRVLLRHVYGIVQEKGYTLGNQCF
jgi:2-C-methyl-D-erythritol 2,4-cyclodiphosphate synthase